MTDEVLVSVDTITIASLMRAMQVLIEAFRAVDPDSDALEAVEQQALQEIKALDTGQFAYEEQAEGLAEGLLLTRSVFRYARELQAPKPMIGAKRPPRRKPGAARSAVCAQRS